MCAASPTLSTGRGSMGNQYGLAAATTIAALAVVGYAAAVAALYLMQERLIFPASTAVSTR